MNKLLVILFLFSGVLKAENPSVLYISQYKEIAISEMHKTGIPASIKMAQALLESGAGRSTLAQKANNHFGIKCGGSWEGDEFYRKDDDYNSNGKLIESCFRKFKSPDHSFVAHSDFLKNQKRYAFLFDLPTSDYHAWAYGLKKAGYATDEAYPKKLINIIEKYQLFLLDNENNKIDESGTSSATIPVDKESNSESKTSNKQQEATKSKRKSSRSKKSRSSKRKKEDSRKSKKKSERKSTKSTSSRSETKSKDVIHVMKEGQTLRDIAKRYGVKESRLRLRNRIPKDAEPVAGEQIYLRKKIRLLQRPEYEKSNTQSRRKSNDKFIF